MSTLVLTNSRMRSFATCATCGAAVKKVTRRRPPKNNFCSKGCQSAHPAKTLADRFWLNVCKGEGCWTWTGYCGAKGYGRTSNGSGRLVLAHRLSYELTTGSIPNGLNVLHRCDNPPCVRPDHLFLGTHVDNMEDRQRKGRTRSAVGVEHRNAILDDDKVREIRSLLAAGEYPRDIGPRFGVRAITVYAIKYGRTWSHVQ